MINLKFVDDQYPKLEINHTRVISRGVVVNDEGKIAILHVVRDDIFGKYDYYELPGGGNDINEDPLDGAIREIHEEVGVVAEVIKELGIVDDYYNLIHRHNINHYYLMKINQTAHQHLEEYETQMIKEILWVDIDTAITLFCEMVDEKVVLLVKRRELPILLEAYKNIKGLVI